MRDKARAFIQAKQGDAHIAAALTERDATIAAQAAELEELRATVDQLAAKAGLEKRGPGRPRNAA
jgi:cell division protein FtsB